MIFNSLFLDKIIHYRNINVIVHGSNTDVFNLPKLETKQNYNIEYKQLDDIFIIDNKPTKKNKSYDLINEISSSLNYYGAKIQKKVIILLNIQNLNMTNLQKIKSITENSYESCCYILHVQNINILDLNIQSRFLILSLPKLEIKDDTIEITYNRILNLIKKKTTKKTIEDVREICYMYYMNHTNSVELQKYLLIKLSDMIILPNQIKYDIVKDICDINYKYRYSYRKPIFLETIIYCLFKHLEHYNINHELL